MNSYFPEQSSKKTSSYFLYSLFCLQKPKAVEDEGPTPEEVEQMKMAEARAKAWEEATAKPTTNTSSMKIAELLSMGL